MADSSFRKVNLVLCIVMVLTSAQIATSQIKKAHPAKKTPASEKIIPKEYNVSATVRPEDASMTIRALADAVRAIRNTPVTSVTVELLPGLVLNVPAEPNPASEPGVIPNPLLLWLNVDAKGDLRLNNESIGSLANLTPMGNYLMTIFRDREKNGVFREGNNDIEKTVWVNLHPDLKVSDLEKAAGMLQVAGCDQIIFAIDRPLIPERLELIETSPFKPSR